MRPSVPAARMMLSDMQHSTATLDRDSRGFGPLLTRCMLCVLTCALVPSYDDPHGPT